MPSEELLRVRRAALAVERAQLEYRLAVVAAHAAGESFSRVAEYASVSRQAVRQLVERSRG